MSALNGGVYANMKFDPYVVREYPKHVKTGPGPKDWVCVNTQREELDLLAEHPAAPGVQDSTLADVAQQLLKARGEKDQLEAQLADMKAKLDALAQPVALPSKDNLVPTTLPEPSSVASAKLTLVTKPADKPAE